MSQKASLLPTMKLKAYSLCFPGSPLLLGEAFGESEACSTDWGLIVRDIKKIVTNQCHCT